MSANFIPWQSVNIPIELQNELNRRKINRSFRYVEASRGEWNNETGEWSKSRGPMSPWVRLCSNSMGLPRINKPGFILFGGKGFYADYGFTATNNNPSVIGYVPNKAHDIHTIDNDLNSSTYPIHVPAPEIERVTVTIQREHFRRASVEWVCFSQKQLEYMTPYFLVLGVSCIMEWGWNHYNPTSLVDITDEELLKNLYNNPYPLYTQNIINSRGNYDVIFGLITGFEWAIDGNKFRCKTEITSKDRIYAGLLVDSTSTDKTNKDDQKEMKEIPINSLRQFINTNLDQFRNIHSNPPMTNPDLRLFAHYVRKKHENNWEEYLHGVFFGRDPQDKKNDFNINTSNKDFDKPSSKDLWLNLGLVIEAINFHSSPPGVKGKEMFRIDIDNVVINAHPNMISADKSICLIPSAIAPKYFYGSWGRDNPTLVSPGHLVSSPVSGGGAVYTSNDYKANLSDADVPQPVSKNHADAKAAGRLADFRLYTVCSQTMLTDKDTKRGLVLRDNIDQLINFIRYKNEPENGTGKNPEKRIEKGSCAFPFINQETIDGNTYPAKYSGLLRHIYVNVEFLKGLLKNTGDIQTYYQFVEKILEGITRACGNFWDLQIVNGNGDQKLGSTDLAPMKIVDAKFMYSPNRGKVWAFDYFDADSLLLGIEFKPTPSNPQIIRTIYASTARPQDTTNITNGTNELLDYHATDRLHIGEGDGTFSHPNSDRSGFAKTMQSLQGITPPEGACQMTTGNIVRRLAIPSTAPDVLQMLLDDGDAEHNPKYTGIMPGIQATFTIQGLGGLRTFMMFLVRNLPQPYSEKDVIFRIIDVQETIEAGKWITVITAGVIPLRGFIKERLGIP